MPFITNLPASAKVLLVEDETVFRDLLALHLQGMYSGLEVLEAENGLDAWALYKKHAPSFCIIDLHMPQMDGFSLLNLIASHHHKSRILILTGRTQLDKIPGLPKTLDSVFWMEKGTSLDVLNDALSVLLGRSKSRESRYRLLKAVETMQDGYPITNREKTILSMIGSGMQIREIAENLGISLFTAQTHRRNLMRKLEIHSSTLLAKFALENGFTIRSDNFSH